MATIPMGSKDEKYPALMPRTRMPTTDIKGLDLASVKASSRRTVVSMPPKIFGVPNHGVAPPMLRPGLQPTSLASSLVSNKQVVNSGPPSAMNVELGLPMTTMASTAPSPQSNQSPRGRLKAFCDRLR